MYEYFDSLTEEKKKLVEEHLLKVIEANEMLNLTRITSVEEARVLHIEDSLSALPELEEAPEGLYGDLGSGAGYPGIPLAIASGRLTVLVDARKKKMEAVESIISHLGLSDQIETFAGRAELLAVRRRGEFAVLTARALSKLSVIIELASPLLANKGRLICYKSHIDEEEFNDALRVQSMVAMKCISDRAFELNGEYTRRIIVFEKSGKPKVKLPRREGEAQKNPLQGNVSRETFPCSTAAETSEFEYNPS